MRQVVGETVLIAIDQYEAYHEALRKQTLQDSLKGLNDAPKSTY
jgi:hypothetical protein